MWLDYRNITLQIFCCTCSRDFSRWWTLLIILIVVAQSRHSTLLPTALVEGIESISARSPCLQVSACISTSIPCRWTGGLQGSTSSTFHLITFAECPPYVAVNYWRPSLSLARVWNSLPQHVTFAPSLSVFRSLPKYSCCFTWLQITTVPCVMCTLR